MKTYYTPPVLVAIAALMAACGSVPNSTSLLDQTRSDYAMAQSNPNVATYAPLELKQAGIQQVYLDGEDEVVDILRLTCFEAGLYLSDSPVDCVLEVNGNEYRRKNIKGKI